MSDSRFYEQMRRQFDSILQQDQQRRWRMQRVLLLIHLLLVLSVPVYVSFRNHAMRETIGVFFTEVIYVLWFLLGVSFLIHLATVVFLTRSRVAETVHESLLLMAVQQDRPEAESRYAEKQKRDQPEAGGEDTAFYAEEEPTPMARQQR